MKREFNGANLSFGGVTGEDVSIPITPLELELDAVDVNNLKHKQKRMRTSSAERQPHRDGTVVPKRANGTGLSSDWLLLPLLLPLTLKLHAFPCTRWWIGVANPAIGIELVGEKLGEKRSGEPLDDEEELDPLQNKICSDHMRLHSQPTL
jgi:hypothetical protein